MDIFIHKTSIVEKNVKIGTKSKIWHWTHICSGSVIGADCNIGQNVYISGSVKIGNNVKIGGGSGVVKDIEDNQIIMGYPAVPFKDFLRKNKK